MNTFEWERKVWDKAVDFDNNYGSQCVDLARDWLKFAGLKQFGPVNGAKDIIKNIDKNCFIIAKEPGEGDLAVWQTGTYGHVAVVTDVMKNTFFVMEQNGLANGGTGTKAYYRRYSRNDRSICFIRGKK